jgi:hypothetical protein
LGVRSERWLRDEVLLNMAWRWFCRQGSTGIHDLSKDENGDWLLAARRATIIAPAR